jgi:ATP-dependent protease ClpP protease subunit
MVAEDLRRGQILDAVAALEYGLLDDILGDPDRHTGRT